MLPSSAIVIGSYVLEFLDAAYDPWFFLQEEWDRRVYYEETIGSDSRDFIGYESTAKKIRHRLFLAGYDDKSLEHDFNNTKKIWIDDIEEQLAYYHQKSVSPFARGKYLRNLVDDIKRSLEVIRAASLDDYKKVFYFIFLRDSEKKDIVTRDVNLELYEIIKDGIQSLVSEQNAGYANYDFPCMRKESIALLLLDICNEDDKCILDLTALVRDGWVDDSYIVSSSLNSKFYDNFIVTLCKLGLLNEERENQILQRMIYSNVITAMESYLSDTIKRTVLSRKAIKIRFIEKHKAFSEKIKINEIFEYIDKIDKIISDEIEKISFHNVVTVKNLYIDVLDCDFNHIDVSRLIDYVSIRHDIVHRNGMKTNGDIIYLSQDDVTVMMDFVQLFIDGIETKMASSRIDSKLD
ncbi:MULTISPECIES: HEPN/Toprim-associated domain-containing protein [Aeromonas]|uniref:HEPN/Toprim-associated domain-containing protein n=1 Tax=Aeromonas TaxID=642 RepID=UPI003527EDCC